MDANEIKSDIKNQISAIDQTFSRYWRHSFNHELLDDNIDHLKFTLKGVLQNFRYYKISIIITLALLSGLSVFSWVFAAIKQFQGTDLASIYNCGFFLNMNNFLVFIYLSFIFLINTLRINKVKENLEKKIILIKLLNLIEENGVNHKKSINCG
jgi:hypothetical protein